MMFQEVEDRRKEAVKIARQLKLKLDKNSKRLFQLGFALGWEKGARAGAAITGQAFFKVWRDE